MEKDTKYLVNIILNENLPEAFDNYKIKFDKDGCFERVDEHGSIKVFEPRLAYFLDAAFWEATNMDTKEVVQLSIDEYRNSYRDGYKRGEAYFQQEFKVSTSVLYEYTEDFVKNMNFHFLEPKKELDGFTLCEKVRKPFINIILTNKLVESYGYYSGMFNSLKNVLDNNPALFKSLEVGNSDEGNINKKLISFRDYFKNEVEDIFLNKISALLDSPKRIAHVIMFLDMNNYIYYPKPRTKLYKAIKEHYNKTFVDKSVNDFLAEYEMAKTYKKDFSKYPKIDSIELFSIKRELLDN